MRPLSCMLLALALVAGCEDDRREDDGLKAARRRAVESLVEAREAEAARAAAARDIAVDQTRAAAEAKAAAEAELQAELDLARVRARVEEIQREIQSAEDDLEHARTEAERLAAKARIDALRSTGPTHGADSAPAPKKKRVQVSNDCLTNPLGC